MVAIAVMLSLGTALGSAADYFDDNNNNVCEGPGCLNPDLLANGASRNAAFGGLRASGLPTPTRGRGQRLAQELHQA
jgi:hypothetical protein